MGNVSGALGANPGLLSFLAHRAPNSVIVTDPAGRIEWVNESFSRLSGYGLEEVYGRVPGSFLQGPSTDPEAARRMGAAVRQREGCETEIINYTKDGRPYWVHIDCQTIVENGELKHFIAIETDITERKTLEKNLLRAERVAKLGHWTLEVATGTVSWSDEAYRIFEIPIGTDLKDVESIIQRYHPTDAADVRAILQQAIVCGEGFDYRKRLLLDGRTKWIDVRAECEPASDGTAARFFGTVQDVTELVDAQETQRHQEDRFRAMADTIPGVAYQWVHWPDGTQGFTYLSPNAPRVFGHSVEALLGDWGLISIDSRDQERFFASIREAIETRQDWTFRGRRLNPDGDIRWFDASAKLINGASGEMIYNGLLVDTTEEAAALQSLHDSELRLRTLMDAIPAGVGYLNADGTFAYANRAARAIAGHENRELTGEHWHAVCDPAAIVYTAPRLGRALAGEAVNYAVTKTMDVVDDEERIYDTTLVPDIDTNGTVHGVFTIAFDVTDYKRRENALLSAREKAQAADQAKSAFLATMSHELRTPLNAINGYAEIMTTGMLGPLGNAKYEGYAADILSSGRYLLDLIEGVLNLSSIEAGQSDLAIEPTAVVPIAADVHRMLNGKARNAGVKLEIGQLDSLEVYADPRALKQVLVNLLDNALKYCRNGDIVQLSATANGHQAAITIADDGPGIAAGDVDRVMQPFVRGGTETPWQACDKPGVGLGLALVKKLAEAMHGRITIDSDIGRGTRVEVLLPTATERCLPAKVG